MVELIFFFLGSSGIFLGVKGLTREGIQVGKDQFITGALAKLIGVFCLILGLACLALATIYVFQKFGSSTDPYGR